MVPQNLRYAETHEWALVEGDLCTVGLTKFATDQLTDLTYMEPKAELGDQVAVGDEVVELEAVKGVNSLYSPVGGVVAALNQQIISNPSSVGSDPYGAGWIIKLKLTPGTNLDHLLTPEQYEKQIASQAHD